MATVISTPVSTWVATLLTLAPAAGGGGVAQSSSLTVTVHLTQGWEIQVPIQFSHVGSISADPVVNIYASMDGGVNYDSNPFLSFALTAANQTAGGARQTSVRLTTGQYCIQLVNSGPNSANFAVLTQLVITGVNNI